MNGFYDPILLPEIDYNFSIEECPKNLQEKILISLIRYQNFINSDKIPLNLIPPINKSYLKNILNLIPKNLMKFDEIVKNLIFQINKLYQIGVKRGILDYFLRDKEIRKKLHISILPKNVLTRYILI